MVNPFAEIGKDFNVKPLIIVYDVDVILEGYCVGVMHQNSETGFFIGFFETEIGQRFKAKGNMGIIEEGVLYKLSGRWKNHSKFGKQFCFNSYKTQLPTNQKAIEKYLIKHCEGIGKTKAKRIVTELGKDTIEICTNDHLRVSKIKSISKNNALKIAKTLRDKRENQECEIELRTLFQDVAVPKDLVSHLMKKYKNGASQKVKENPFFLIEEKGIGFLKADKIRENAGHPENSIFRINAGIDYTFLELYKKGHTYDTEENIIQYSAKNLSLKKEIVQKQVLELIESKVIERWQEKNLSYCDMYKNEIFIANNIIKKLKIEKQELTFDEKVNNLASLGIDQREAVRKFFKNRAFIITGAPGTGKTHVVKTIIEALPQGINTLLLAPTGKAAKRLEESTGVKAYTIHSAVFKIKRERLETEESTKIKDFFENEIDEQEKILEKASGSLVVIDEFSMVDTLLFKELLEIIYTETRILIVGDIHQLPSIGPGNLLRDLINKGIPCKELTEIKRQKDEKGQIIINCHKIKNGYHISFDNNHKGDFFWKERKEQTEILQAIKEIYSNGKIEKFFKGINILKDMQIISPRKKGSLIACENLNEEIRFVINFENQTQKPFWKGDKVIQTKNDYGLKIINGDIGYIENIYLDTNGTETLLIRFETPKRIVSIPMFNNDLLLAYAVTIHKYQGSESDIVIMPIHNSIGGFLLQRNLVYTGISRAKKMFCGIGQINALNKAIDNNVSIKRKTFLPTAIDLVRSLEDV